MKHNFFYLSLLILAGCVGKPQEQSLQFEKDIMKVKLKELNGDVIDFSQYEGKTVFINFWATWCKPCIQEMPTIESVQKTLDGKDIVFLLASNENLDQIENFIKKRKYVFHYVQLENMEELKIQALPTTYIFNPEGKLKFSETGFRKWDDSSNIELITKIMNDHEK